MQAGHAWLAIVLVPSRSGLKGKMVSLGLLSLWLKECWRFKYSTVDSTQKLSAFKHRIKGNPTNVIELYTSVLQFQTTHLI